MSAIFTVWMRYFEIFRRNLVFSVVTTLVEPLLFLGSFGFGVGSMVPDLQFPGLTLTYRQFVLVGIVAQSVLFQAFFESAYGSFVRMHYQRIFQAIAMTPITLGEVLWGEILWDTARASFAALCVLAIGVALGDFSAGSAVLAVPFVLLGSLLFSGFGLLASSLARTIDDLQYAQYLAVFPMFLFSGVFFPLTSLPVPFQWAAWIFPLTPLLDVLRFLLLDLPMVPVSIPLLVGWTAVMLWLSRQKMTKRIIAA